jgi:hypothetical protein
MERRYHIFQCFSAGRSANESRDPDRSVDDYEGGSV